MRETESRSDPRPDPRRDDPKDLVGRVVAGKYEVISYIDRGAVGAVYRALQRSVGREVVLKVLRPSQSEVFEADPDFAERFKREAATYGRLRHPNTVTLFDSGEHWHDETLMYFMVLEYVQGRTLRRLLREHGRILPERAAWIAIQICRSLREAHGLGIVHRDLKPGNVMIAEAEDGEHVKVLDFGVAKVVPDNEVDENAITRTGILVGSPGYMAPEQIRGGTIDGRSDIYALGCILFEMLSGVPPFRGNGPIETCAQHLSRPVPSMEEAAGFALDLPPELEPIVVRCLQKRPEDRYQTVDELIEALGRACDLGEPSSIAKMSRLLPISPPPPRRRSSPVLWLAIGLLVAGVPSMSLGIVALFVLLWMPRAAEETPDPPAEPPDEVVSAGGPSVVEDARILPGLVLKAEPEAEVWQGEVQLGRTPLPLSEEQLADGPIELRAEGFLAVAVDPASLRAEPETIFSLKPVSRPTRPRPGPVEPAPFRPDVRTER